MRQTLRLWTVPTNPMDVFLMLRWSDTTPRTRPHQNAATLELDCRLGSDFSMEISRLSEPGHERKQIAGNVLIRRRGAVGPLPATRPIP
jgi:hypothetical protein